MLVSGTFANPKFAPDAAQVANFKLRGLLPTANNPSELTSRVKGIVDAFTGKQGNTTTTGDTKPGDGKSDDSVQGTINLFDQFRKKKPEPKQ